MSPIPTTVIPTPVDTPQWTAEQTAEHLGFSIGHLYKLARAGRIPHWRIGRVLRFDPTDVQAWNEQRTIRVAP